MFIKGGKYKTEPFYSHQNCKLFQAPFDEAIHAAGSIHYLASRKDIDGVPRFSAVIHKTCKECNYACNNILEMVQKRVQSLPDEDDHTDKVWKPEITYFINFFTHTLKRTTEGAAFM